MHIYEQIRARIQKLPMWTDITAGETGMHCKDFTAKAYDAIEDIDGLSILTVRNASHGKHTYLLAHHPEAGFFIIDPTAGQVLGIKGKPYNDIFVGKYDELVEVAKEHNIFNWHYNWTPAVYAQDEYREVYYNSTMAALWEKYPYANIRYHMAFGIKADVFIATSFEEMGYDWRVALKDDPARYWKDDDHLLNTLNSVEAAISESRRSR